MSVSPLNYRIGLHDPYKLWYIVEVAPENKYNRSTTWKVKSLNLESRKTINPNIPGPFHSRIQREETINWSLHQPPRASFIEGDKILEFQMYFLKMEINIGICIN